MTASRCVHRVGPSFWLALLVGLAACSAEGSERELALDELATLEAPLLASTASTLVQGVGDAENATFASDGRLFVTGGENAYEIVKEGANYRAIPLYDGTCNFTGISERAGYLYATCAAGADLLSSTPHLLAAPLASPLKLKVVYDFQRLGIPNGIAFDERGRLFVTDFTPLLGKIVALSFDPRQPTRVVKEEVWHAMGHPLANGIKVHRGAVYMTDLTDLKRIPIRADGSAGRARVLATRLSVLDDLYVDDARILVADFYSGQIASYSHEGALLEQTEMLFESPSSITPGRAPLFPAGSWVVTEKGTLGELTSTVGNRVSLLRP